MDKTIVKAILTNIKQEYFVADYRNKATDEEAMGLLISNYFSWDGLAILRSTYNALEDANFHTENETIQKMIDTIEGKFLVNK